MKSPLTGKRVTDEFVAQMHADYDGIETVRETSREWAATSSQTRRESAAQTH